MIKVKYKEIRSNGFQGSMQKLGQCTEYGDIKVSYNVMRMAKALEKELKTSQELWLPILDKYIKKDENGRVQFANGSFVWKDGVNAEEAKKAVEDFDEMEVTVDRFKLKVQTLLPARLSPADLAMLEPIIDLAEIEAPEPKGKVLQQIK